MVFLGYAKGTKTYRLYDPRGDKVLVSRDVVFDEKAAWDWSSPSTGEAGGFTSTFVVKHLVIHGGGDGGQEVLSTLERGAEHSSGRAEQSWGRAEHSRRSAEHS